MLNPPTDSLLPLRGLVEFSWYPTDAESARVLVVWTNDEPVEIRLAVGDNAPRTLSLIGAGKTLVHVPLAGLAAGRHPLRLTAAVPQREPVMAQDVIVKRAPPKSGVRLNRFLRCFELDGKPWFPIIFHPRDRDLLEDWQLERLAGHGFNTLVPIMPPRIQTQPVEAARAMLDHCAAQRFKVIYWVDADRAYGIPAGPKPIARCQDGLREIINDFRDHPAGLAWYIMDEPQKDFWETQFQYKESDLKLLYETASAADPDIPITINHCHFRPRTPLYGGFDAQDFNMFDVYPWYPDERADPLRYFAETVQGFNELVAPLGRVMLFWLQTWGARDAFREPTPDEWQNTVYCSLIHGARGLAYFMCQPCSVPLWERMGEVHAQIRALEPVFFHHDVEEFRGIYNASVHYAIWCTPDAVHVMAANVLESHTGIDLDLKRITGHQATEGRVLFEQAAQCFKGGRLADKLAPGQSRVYRFVRAADVEITAGKP